GTLTLSSVSSSRVFMDYDIQPTIDYFNWYLAKIFVNDQAVFALLGDAGPPRTTIAISPAPRTAIATTAAPRTASPPPQLLAHHHCRHSFPAIAAHSPFTVKASHATSPTSYSHFRSTLLHPTPKLSYPEPLHGHRQHRS
ncbi:unnamed protein product, partial [Brassica oleracea]